MIFKFSSTESVLFALFVIVFLLGVLFNIKTENVKQDKIVKILNVPKVEEPVKEEEESEEYEINLNNEIETESESENNNFKESSEEDSGSFKLNFEEEK